MNKGQKIMVKSFSDKFKTITIWSKELEGVAERLGCLKETFKAEPEFVEEHIFYKGAALILSDICDMVAKVAEETGTYAEKFKYVED